jgi:hypothetical protein
MTDSTEFRLQGDKPRMTNKSNSKS